MEVVNKFMDEINLFGVVATFIGLFFGILAFFYSRKVAILQGTFKKSNIKMFCKGYDLFEMNKIYFVIPFQNNEEIVAVPFEYGLVNQGDKTAVDIQVQYISAKVLFFDQEHLRLEKKRGHYFHKMDLSVSDIGNKRSLAFYLQKLEPNQIINTQFNFLITHPEHSISVPVTFKDKSKVKLQVKVKLNFVLDFLLTSNDSKPQISRHELSIIDSNTTSFNDMFMKFSNNKVLKFWQIKKIKISAFYHRKVYDNFLLFIVDRDKLSPHISVPNLFTINGDFNDLEKLVGFEKNGKLISYKVI